MSRYARQEILPSLGKSGQAAIKRAKVLVIGAGGLGLPCLQSLVAAGVGHITIMDDDVVELSNLQRQILFTEGDIGSPKAVVASLRAHSQNAEVRVSGIEQRFSAENARALVHAHDLTIDGSDNFATKFLINDASLLEGKPWIYGSVSRFEGQVAAFDGAGGGCYRCIFPEAPVSKIENCAEQGVLGAVTGIVGNYQALLALKMILFLDAKKIHAEAGTVKVFDFLSGDHYRFTVSRRENCHCANPHAIALVLENRGCERRFPATWLDFERERGEKFLIDVRTAEEFQAAHHPLAVHWDGGNLAAILEAESQAKIFLYCRSGARARARCGDLRRRGIEAFFISESWSDRP